MSTAPDLRARLLALEAEHASLAQQLDAECLRVYGSAVQGRAFSSLELWRHQVVSLELREVFVAAGIRSSRHLGKQLQRLARDPHAGWSLVRVGHDDQGVIWALTVRAHCQVASCAPALTRV